MLLLTCMLPLPVSACSGLSAGAVSNNPMYAGTPGHPTPPSVNLKSFSGRLSGGTAGVQPLGPVAGLGVMLHADHGSLVSTLLDRSAVAAPAGTPQSAGSSGSTPASTGMKLAEKLHQGKEQREGQ